MRKRFDLLVREIILKKSIEKQCLFYRSSESPDAVINAGHCDLDRHTKCTGEMQFCKKRNTLRKHLAERWLGWERKSRRRSGLAGKPITEFTPGLCLRVIMEYIYGLSNPLLLLIAFVMSSVVGVLNYFVGAERSSSIFYFFPISMVTWFTKRWTGIVMSAVCALTWVAADVLSQTTFSLPDNFYWNGMMRLSSFLLFALVLAILKTESIHEKEASRVDPLTGVKIRRFFLGLADREIQLRDTPFEMRGPDQGGWAWGTGQLNTKRSL
jgi:hypothetical protein